jgi:CxxC motif-containing protein (DUF1111 family)
MKNDRSVAPLALAAMLLLSLSVVGCGGDGGSSSSDPDIFGALGEPLPTASEEQLESFARGVAVAQRHFTDADGLGPEFNLTSCGGCHEKPVTGGGGPRYRNFLLVRAVLSDGSFVNLGANGVQPHFTLEEGGRRPTDPGTNLEAARNPIPFFGVGLVAELDEASILDNVDEHDADGDGISGRANFDRGFVGRFGVKAQTVSIEGFIRGPLFNHLGLTSNPLSDELKARLPVPSAIVAGQASRRPEPGVVHQAQVAAPEEPNFDEDGVPDPELSEQDLFDLVSFSMLLAAPQPDPPTAQSEAGRDRFDAIGCTGCHVPALDGPRGPVPLYSDLLLHDMGEELADGITMGLATESEFRTQPLWGVAAAAPYLHDGRADTIDEAIRLHGGEAEPSRDAYVDLPEAARAEVLAFLDSLGGAAQRSDGLLPPDAPIPPAGQLGGPAFALSPVEQDLFRRGRAVFDRDHAIANGLGPNFNGDSCRACHSLPTIGGGGAADVDVTRHGHLDDGVFTAPEQGTMAHRHSVDGVRPVIDESANVFETRQTPPIFGLGFLESIPVADIVANEDCLNPDPNAISGCAHILMDGSLGRLGWKADVPNLAEFSRDAMFNEMGVTLPEAPGMRFGATTDDDDAADPEISAADVEALTFFMRSLAPPRPRSVNAAVEADGAFLFDRIGCTDCHTTEFVTPDGVVAYTDMLLHQVAPEGSPGVASGNALPLEFRTTPLWGLGLSEPYMHDGRSFTIEDAIARHEAESAASRRAFEDLSAEERAAVLSFLETR